MAASTAPIATPRSAVRGAVDSAFRPADARCDQMNRQRKMPALSTPTELPPSPFGEFGGPAVPIIAPCLASGTTVASEGHKTFCVDVEGSELDVLQSVPDLQEHPFDVILVENEYNNLRDQLVRKLLLSSGYTKMVIPKPTHGGSNDLYVARALVDAANALFDNRTDNRHRPIGSYAPHNPVEAMRQRLEKVGVPVASGAPN